MRKIIFFVIMCINYNIIAQINDDLIIKQIERMTENSEESDIDYSELIEAYWDITENQININGEDIEVLTELKFISIFDLENIKKYIKEYGNLQFIEELYEIEGLDNNTIEMIKPLICFNDSKKKKLKLNDILKYGKNKVIFEVDQCLNTKKGYTNINDSTLYKNLNSIYLGSPQKLCLRYNYSYNNRIETGFVFEKDPGEYIFKGNINDSLRNAIGNKCYSGFDYFSFHIFVKDIMFLKALAIGDYKISFGQGLTMGSGMTFIAKGGTLLRTNKKIAASKSANESYYLRGIATTLEYKKFELSVFYSNKHADGNITSKDTDSIPIEISSLQQSGLHRTFNEIMDRKTVRKQLYGLNFSYQDNYFQIGYTFHRTNLSTNLNPAENVYNKFNFRGRNIANHGIDFHYILDNILFYGEFALSDNKGTAGLIGTTIQPKGYIDFTILYRNYSKKFQCLYSNAFSAGSKPINEEGIFFSTSISIASNWELITSIDFYKSDWFKNTTYSPSKGCECNTQLNYQPDNKTLVFFEYRNKNKDSNTKDIEIYQKHLISKCENLLRFHISHDVFDNITLKNRIEFHFNKEENDVVTNSYLIYQDIIYNSIDKKFGCAFRFELFNSENGNVYAHESDIPYSFSVGSLSGKGIRTYFVGKVRFGKHIQISSKIGLTYYDNKKEIGSGLECISSNWKCDGKLQLIWST